MVVHLWEEIVTIPTYPVGSPNPHPPFQRKGYWEVYPYALVDQLSEQAEPRQYRALFLENPYLRVMVLPEVGGRVWSLYDKIADRECLHQPPSLKPALIGLTGAWVAGGIEFNFPIGHRYTTHQPVIYTLEPPREEGEKATIWIGEVCRRTRMMWMVGLSLYPDKAFLETDIRLFNRSELKKRFYFWTNCAVSAHEGWKWLLPASSVRNWEGDLSEARATLPFPVADGVDWSLYRSYNAPSSVFAHAFRGDYFGGYDLQADVGLLHVANWYDVCGRKLFTWGTSDDGAVWTQRLDDRGVAYVEIQVGRFEDQSVWQWIAPHAFECWQEAWLPIREMEGVVSAASREGALGVQLQGQQLSVYCYVTSSRPDHRLILQYGDDIVHEQRVDLYPEHVGKWRFSLPQPPQVPLKVIVATAGREPLLQAVAEAEPRQEQLVTVSPPSLSYCADDLYLRGDALERANNVEPAERFYLQAMAQGSLEATTALARIRLEQGCLLESLQLAERVLKRDPQNGEALYLKALSLMYLGNETKAQEALYLLRRDAEYRGLAFYWLALGAMRRGDYRQADELLAEALLYNAADVKAWMIRAVALRQQGELEEAAQIRLQVHLLAPLEPLLRSEAFLSTVPSPEADATNLLRPLCEQPHTFEEVACDYLNAGCINDAIRLLEAPARLGVAETAMRHYLLGLAYARKGIAAQTAEHALLASRSDTSYLFPWRLEDYLALQEALRVRPNDSLVRYATGNFLMAHRRFGEALLEWLRLLNARAVEEALESGRVSPQNLGDFNARRAWRQLAQTCLKAPAPRGGVPVATLYRNIGMALAEHGRVRAIARLYYEKALELAPQDHHLWLEWLDLVRAQAHSSVRLLARLRRAPEKVLGENRLAQRYAQLLVEAGEYDLAIQVLHSRLFHVAEGETSTRPTWVGAYLGKGKQLAEQGDWQGALQCFERALEYPHHLGVGKPASPADAKPLFYAGLACSKLGRTTQALHYWQQCLRSRTVSDEDVAYQSQAAQLLESLISRSDAAEGSP